MKLLLFLTSSIVALAGPITYTFTATVTGTLGTTPFTNASLIAVAIGDTANAGPDGGGGFINDIGAGLATISISGVGSGTFTDLMYVFSCPGCGPVIELQEQSTAIGGFDFTSAGLGSNYDLTTAIGPVSSTDPVAPNFLPWSVATSFGTFNITSIDNPTFQATLGGASVPEPGTFLLLSLGLLAAAGLKHYFG
jgi:PEP-CTERM motif